MVLKVLRQEKSEKHICEDDQTIVAALPLARRIQNDVVTHVKKHDVIWIMSYLYNPSRSDVIAL